MDLAFEDQVRQRAYQIWLELGQEDGQAHEHWLAAERDLRAGETAPSVMTPAAAAKAKASAKPATAKPAASRAKSRAKRADATLSA